MQYPVSAAWTLDGRVMPDEASDIGDSILSSFCNTTAPKSIQFTKDGNNLKVGGVWNELWVPKP